MFSERGWNGIYGYGVRGKCLSLLGPDGEPECFLKVLLAFKYLAYWYP